MKNPAGRDNDRILIPSDKFKDWYVSNGKQNPAEKKGLKSVMDVTWT